MVRDLLPDGDLGSKATRGLVLHATGTWMSPLTRDLGLGKEVCWLGSWVIEQKGIFLAVAGFLKGRKLLFGVIDKMEASF